MPINEPDVIPVNCIIPPELLSMMDDYKSIVNHLLAFGIHHKIGLEKHYYPLASTDDSGKPKPIPPFRELRDGNMGWFREYYGKYPVHYLGAASSFAMQLIKSWRALGGDITSIPHLRKPIARLDNDLYVRMSSWIRGMFVYEKKNGKQKHEDLKYMIIAGEVASSSTCAKKQLGCVLVLKNTNTNIITGANGPPAGLKKCDPCPRLDSHNGVDTQKCRAVHAERQTILKAACFGLSTAGSTLYSYMGVPCKDCLLELWEAGIAEIVVMKETYYDELSKSILKEWIDSGGKFRVVRGS